MVIGMLITLFHWHQLRTKDELIKLCHYSNLQPLWADNLSKGENARYSSLFYEPPKGGFLMGRIMNILPVVPTLKLASAVTALLGTNPLRVYEDIAPHKTPYPYAVWSVVTANPENNLDCPANLDHVSIPDCGL